MRVLVTGGAGFIGSHTADRLVSLGHEVTVLDALTAPVHRDRTPNYLTPGADLYVGDVRNRDLLANLLRRTDAVYHFAAYQDYLTDFSTFTDVNVTSTALLYETIVAEKLDMMRVVVASSQSAMGEGLYRCAEHGEQTPDMRPESQLARSDMGHRVPGVRRSARDAGHARSGSTTRRTRTACRSTARRWWRSTSAAATTSRASRCATASCRARGSRCSTPTPARAASSTCTTCWAARPRCTRTARRSATTSTSTTWSTRTC